MGEARAYIRDGAEIYKRSFAIIRSEADLSAFKGTAERVAVRLIHACGMVEIARDLVMSPDFAERAQAALLTGAPIFCDRKMVAHGITRSRLPANNAVICTLDDPRVPGLARDLETTRSAAAMELWRDHLGGALVAIGNAPTSLFRLWKCWMKTRPSPAAVIGMPVGFVGAAEFERGARRRRPRAVPIVRGRKGGSAMAVAVVNALASEEE